MITVRTLTEDGMLLSHREFEPEHEATAEAYFDSSVDLANRTDFEVAVTVQYFDGETTEPPRERRIEPRDTLAIDYESTDDWHG